MPSRTDPFCKSTTAGVGVLAHQSDFIRHSQALGMNRQGLRHRTVHLPVSGLHESACCRDRRTDRSAPALAHRSIQDLVVAAAARQALIHPIHLLSPPSTGPCWSAYVTPLAGAGANWVHSHGCASVEEGIREAIFAEIASAEFPFGAVPVVAVLGTQLSFSEPTVDGAKPQTMRRAIIIGSS